MLNYFFLKQGYINSIKNGFYLDYGLKIVIKQFVYNIYIQLAYFFAEKYLIEYLTRYWFNYASYMFIKVGVGLHHKKLFVISIAAAANFIFLLI